MPNLRVEEPEEENLLTANWDPEAERCCIVCHRPAEGKAICADPRCAAELADS
jgi:hypothetical protein